MQEADLSLTVSLSLFLSLLIFSSCLSPLSTLLVPFPHSVSLVYLSFLLSLFLNTRTLARARSGTRASRRPAAGGRRRTPRGGRRTCSTMGWAGLSSSMAACAGPPAPTQRASEARRGPALTQTASDARRPNRCRGCIGQLPENRRAGRLGYQEGTRKSPRPDAAGPRPGPGWGLGGRARRYGYIGQGDTAI